MVLTQAQLWGENAPGITNPIVSGIVTGTPSVLSGWVNTGIWYDVAIAGIPFRSGENLRNTYFRHQYTREFADQRKPQFDANTNAPGEQSLAAWWLRSQTSFLGGAGIQYLDTQEDVTLDIRYLSSERVNPWTVGQVSLLPLTVAGPVTANGNIHLAGFSSGGTDYVLYTDGTALKRMDGTGTATAMNLTGLTPSAFLALAVDGTNWYAMDASFIYTGPLDNSAAGTKLYTVTGSPAQAVLGWAKNRLVGGFNHAVYELVPSGVPPLALPTPVYTSPNAGYQFTSISEGPGAIFVAGRAGSRSDIFRFTLNTVGSMPVLTSAVSAAQLPTGETVNTIYNYLGNFLGIATSQGFRVATVDASSNLVYSTLLFTPTNSGGCFGIVGYNRWFFTGGNSGLTSNGLSRIDPGQATSNDSFAYANDLDSHLTGPVQDVALLGNSNRLVFWVNGTGLFYQHATQLEASGYLSTSKVRFNTLENKHFKYMVPRFPQFTGGTITIAAANAGGGSVNLVTLTASGNEQSVFIGDVGNSQEWLQLTFTLARDPLNAANGPVLAGYQLKALPGAPRQRLITVPVMLFDDVKDHSGSTDGRDGWAWQRLQMLEQAAGTGNVVQYQDLNTGEVQLVTVENYSFEQQANPAGRPVNAALGIPSQTFQGVLSIQLRTLM